MQKIYSTFQVKAVDDDERLITGIASTPSTDRMGDVVEPKGAKFTLPMPLLWQHRADSPIGMITAAKVSKDGIEIAAQIAKGVHADIDKAWSLIKAGLVRGLSIGFKELDSEAIPDSWGRKFTKWEWLETSAVTIAANADASITNIKTFDENPEIPLTPEAASAGTTLRVVKLNDPARRGASPPFVIRKINPSG